MVFKVSKFVSGLRSLCTLSSMMNASLFAHFSYNFTLEEYYLNTGLTMQEGSLVQGLAIKLVGIGLGR